jgi:Fur family iron response transcriptional regulator
MTHQLKAYKKAKKGAAAICRHCDNAYHLQIAVFRFKTSTKMSPGGWISVRELDVAIMQTHEIINSLRDAGLRPTRQRLALAELLFRGGDRHVTAELLHDEAVKADIPVSLATVYNSLNQFKDAGLLREVAIDGTKTYFDTNTKNHQHFYFEATGRLTDIPGGALQVAGIPDLPDGTEISRIDVVVRLAGDPDA